MVEVARSDDPLAVLGTDGAVYILPTLRTVFVSVAKNACTSLKWVLADIAGEDIAASRSGLNSYASDDHLVHSRGAWKHAFTPAQLDPEQRRQIRPDNGWFVFGVVRDPRARLFSAWQDKLLMQNPGFTRYRGKPWFPRMPTDADALIEDFARFVDMGVRNMDHQLFKDNHFRPQTIALKLHAVTYSRIYEIGEMQQLRADLLAHVRAQGWSGELTQRRSANDTPLRANGALFTEDVRAKVEAMYARDFERFGDLWDFAAVARNPEWTEQAMAEVRLRAAFGRRIGDLRDIALENKRRAREAIRRAERAEAQVRALGGRPARTGGVRTRLRPVVRRIRRRLAGRD